MHSLSVFLVGSVLLIFSVFYVVLLCVFTFSVPCCDLPCDFRIKTMFTSSYLYEGLKSYLRYLCLFTYSGLQHILCCVFLLFVGTVVAVIIW